MSRSPFAGCLCATGSNPICPADRHLSPIVPEVRRVRRAAVARIEQDHVQRRLVRYVGFALALALAIPGSAFAADATSDTAESLSVASTVSMTAPATATYVLGDEDGANGPDFAYTVAVTVIGSNNPTGVTVKAKVDPWAQGAITVPTTKRATLLSESATGTGAVLTKAASVLPPGTFATSGTTVNLASSTGPLANRQIGVTFYVDADEFSVGGSYTSAVHYTTSTNP